MAGPVDTWLLVQLFRSLLWHKRNLRCFSILGVFRAIYRAKSITCDGGGRLISRTRSVNSSLKKNKKQWQRKKKINACRPRQKKTPIGFGGKVVATVSRVYRFVANSTKQGLVWCCCSFYSVAFVSVSNLCYLPFGAVLAFFFLCS